MKIVIDEKAVKRNSRIGFIATFLGPIVFGISLSIALTNPTQIAISLFAFVLGLFIFALSSTFRRFVRGKEFNLALKKLGNDYTLYHFITPVSHLLVGPAGIWILVPKYARGTVTYDESRGQWKFSRHSFLAKTFFFMTEGIGRPAVDVLREADMLDRYLRKNWELEERPHIEAAIVFMDDETEVDAKSAPIATLSISKLREHIRKKEAENKMSHAALKAFNKLFEGAS